MFRDVAATMSAPSSLVSATALRGGPVAPSRSRLRPLGPDEISIDGGFWGERQALNSDVILAHCEIWMERIGWVANFDRTADGTVGRAHSGIEFVDSEIYKLLEAMAWELARRPSPALDARYRDLVARVAAAQEPDGYLHTSFGHPGQPDRYSNLEWGHELYCFGHLMQAAVARIRGGHDDELVDVARRLADHVYREFGPDGRSAICGHPEIEVALAELSRALDEPRYLELARLFIERRGNGLLATTILFGHEYFQDDLPVRDATVLRGHAVRALYLASGALDVATETGDRALADAVALQWRNTVSRRTYITGGMGSHHQDEAFGVDYELPADRAYSETCAGIGSVMLSWRLLLQSGDAAYADLIERTLLNNVLASPREDGRAFFYTNPLQQRTVGMSPSDDQLSERAEASLRAPWFEVSCCPTNVARTLASVALYFATADATGVQLHQYGDASIRTTLPDGRVVALEVRTGYPFTGDVTVTVLEAVAADITLRVPSWAQDAATLTVGGATTAAGGTSVTVSRRFEAGEVFTLHLPMEPRVVHPHPRIDAVRGTVAVERGPLVLALESPDLPDLPDLTGTAAGMGSSTEQAELDLSRPVISTPTGATAFVRLRAEADADPVDSAGAAPAFGSPAWPYGPGDPAQAPSTPVNEVALIPYFAWANRGPSTMRVWLPVAPTP